MKQISFQFLILIFISLRANDKIIFKGRLNFDLILDAFNSHVINEDIVRKYNTV